MANSPTIHDLVLAALNNVGLAVSPPLIHTILIRNRHFFGHKYRFDGGYAVMFDGNDTLEVFDDGGELLKKISIADTGRPAAA